MSQQPNQSVDQIKTFADQKLSEDIQRIHQALVVNAEVRKIPERTFVTEILPVLTGKVISEDFPLLMAGVAGSPFSEVDIIDEAGNTLFRLPALLERNIISHEEASRRGSLGSMMETLNQVSRRSPIQARNYLAHEFNGRGIAQNRDEQYKARQERFNVIFARYGKTLNPDGTVADIKATSADTKKKELPPLDTEDGELL
jgi:hypothetical protein